jgi:hypothetical protein
MLLSFIIKIKHYFVLVCDCPIYWAVLPDESGNYKNNARFGLKLPNSNAGAPAHWAVSA